MHLKLPWHGKKGISNNQMWEMPQILSLHIYSPSSMYPILFCRHWSVSAICPVSLPPRFQMDLVCGRFCRKQEGKLGVRERKKESSISQGGPAEYMNPLRLYWALLISPSSCLQTQCSANQWRQFYVLSLPTNPHNTPLTKPPRMTIICPWH